MAKQLFCVLNDVVLSDLGVLIPKGAPVKIEEWDVKKKKVLISTTVFIQDINDKKTVKSCAVYINPQILTYTGDNDV